MTPRTRIVTIHTSPIRMGGWCEKCQLPSLIEYELMTLSDSGVNVLATIKRCVDEDEQGD